MKFQAKSTITKTLDIHFNREAASSRLLIFAHLSCPHNLPRLVLTFYVDWIVVDHVYRSNAKGRFYLNPCREFDIVYAALRYLVDEAKFPNQSEPI